MAPEPEKAVIVARDQSWSLRLEPCFPQELPDQVERLAETSLAHGSHEERGEAYWDADDAIREAYSLPPTPPDTAAREEGLAGWLGSRLDLVRSGWRRLVALSKALAQRIGDPLGEVLAEEEARRSMDSRPRWSRIAQLDDEIQAMGQDTANPSRPTRKSRGWGR